jgi:hypothetical protein
MLRPDHNINMHVRKPDLGNSPHGTAGIIVNVNTTEKDQNPFHGIVAAVHLPASTAKSLLEQSVTRTKQHTTLTGHFPRVSGLHVRVEILIQKQVAVMLTVGNIVDNKNLPCHLTQCRLPTRIECVMINNQPIPMLIRQGRNRILRII